MRSLFPWLLIATILMASASFASEEKDSAQNLTYLAEELAPYNYLKGGQASGIAVDVLHMMWKEMGIPQQEIRFLPWARAYDTTLHQPGYVLLTTVRTPNRIDRFKWVGPIADFKVSLMALKKNGLKLNTVEDVRKLSVGVVTGNASVDLLHAMQIRRVEALPNIDLHIHKLLSGRIDAVSLEEGYFWDTIKKLGLDPGQFEVVWTIKELTACYAFNKTTPDVTIQRFQQALDAVRESTAYAEAIQRHFE